MIVDRNQLERSMLTICFTRRSVIDTQIAGSQTFLYKAVNNRKRKCRQLARLLSSGRHHVTPPRHAAIMSCPLVTPLRHAAIMWCPITMPPSCHAAMMWCPVIMLPSCHAPRHGSFKHTNCFNASSLFQECCPVTVAMATAHRHWSRSHVTRRKEVNFLLVWTTSILHNFSRATGSIGVIDSTLLRSMMSIRGRGPGGSEFHWFFCSVRHLQ